HAVGGQVYSGMAHQKRFRADPPNEGAREILSAIIYATH
ncbi:MAG: hypothetical protein ACI89J_002639, partial [Hyphomicrobiaceae bacterium]